MRQLTFPRVMECTHIYPDGTEEKVRYGKFEAVMIEKENGWTVNRCVPSVVSINMVTEVTKTNGTKIVFDKPWFTIYESNYGDESGRIAPKMRDM